MIPLKRFPCSFTLSSLRETRIELEKEKLLSGLILWTKTTILQSFCCQSFMQLFRVLQNTEILY